MIISSEILKYLKDIPNSTYESIKTEFLCHSNKLGGEVPLQEKI